MELCHEGFPSLSHSASSDYRYHPFLANDHQRRRWQFPLCSSFLVPISPFGGFFLPTFLLSVQLLPVASLTPLWLLSICRDDGGSYPPAREEEMAETTN